MSNADRPESDETQSDRLRPTAKLRVNRWCDEFESLWQSGCGWNWTSLFAECPDDDLHAVIRELVDIDVEYRQRARLPLDIKAYLERFPMLDRQWLAARAKTVEHPTKPAPSQMVIATLKQLGDYNFLGPLGAGGMGQVYRAEHRLMGRQVAIKVLKENRAQDPSSKLRFEREVRTIAKLSHPNIVSAFDAREANGVLFLVTELVDGEDLASLVKRKGPLKPVDAMYYVWQAAKGLKLAHEQGIIHRDVKPGNLILERKKTVKVLDLGLARLLDADHETASNGSAITNIAHIVGTAHFMSPEQATTPEQVDPRSDIYSLGCTLYYLVQGQPPFQKRSDVETILAHLHAPAPSLFQASNQPASAKSLNNLVLRMLEKEPSKRPESMDEVVTSLAELIKLERVVSASKLRTTVSLTKFVNQFEAIDRVGKVGAFACLLGLLGVVIWRSDIRRDALTPFPTPAATYSPKKIEPKRPQSNAPALPRNTINATWKGGLNFDGQKSLVRIPLIHERVTDSCSIEAAVIARPQRTPANIVTFSGTQCMALFIANNVWGVAYFNGQIPRLVVSESYVQYGKPTLVAGQYQNGQLTLWLNGIRVTTRLIEYPMQPGPDGLYFGGVPEGVLPAEQGTRYFDGCILAVRIHAGRLPLPASSIEELCTVHESTIVLFRLNEGAGSICNDSSSHSLRGEIVGATWN